MAVVTNFKNHTYDPDFIPHYVIKKPPELRKFHAEKIWEIFKCTWPKAVWDIVPCKGICPEHIQRTLNAPQQLGVSFWRCLALGFQCVNALFKPCESAFSGTDNLHKLLFFC